MEAPRSPVVQPMSVSVATLPFAAVDTNPQSSSSSVQKRGTQLLCYSRKGVGCIASVMTTTSPFDSPLQQSRHNHNNNAVLSSSGGRPKASIHSLHRYNNWFNAWDLIVTGDFGGTTGRDDVLFYSREAGRGMMFSIDMLGQLTPLHKHVNWSHSWDMIVVLRQSERARRQNPAARDQLLFYDRSQSKAIFYQVYEKGEMKALGDVHNKWVGWTHIVPLGDDRGLLCYNRDSNTGFVYTYDGQGNEPHYLQRHALGAQDIIVPCRNTLDVRHTTRSQHTIAADLLLYNITAGALTLIRIGDDGALIFLRHTDYRSLNGGWTHIILGPFVQPSMLVDPVSNLPCDDILCFSSTAGNASVINAEFQEIGSIFTAEPWDIIVPLHPNVRHGAVTVPLQMSAGALHIKRADSPAKEKEEEEGEYVRTNADIPHQQQHQQHQQQQHQQQRHDAELAQLLRQVRSLEIEAESREAKASAEIARLTDALKKSQSEAAHLRGEQLTELSLEELATLESQLLSAYQKAVAQKGILAAAEKEADKRLCVVCLETEKQVVLMPCKHLCCCPVCANQMQRCPVCRAVINDRVRVYES